MRILLLAISFLFAATAYGVDTCSAIFGTPLRDPRLAAKALELPAEFGEVKSYPLSLENGRDKLDVIRINYWNTEHGHEVLRDYVRILSRINDLRLLVSVKEKALSDLYDRLDDVPDALLNRIEFVTESRINKYYGYDLWAQDASKPLKSTVPATLLFNTSKSEIFQAEKQGLLQVESFPVPLQGGNIIVGDRHILVGPDEIQSTQAQLGTTPELAKAYLEKTFGKPLILMGVTNEIGELAQRSFHTDLDIVLLVDRTTGKEKVLMRSPMELLAGLLKRPVPSEVSESQFEAMREAIKEKFAHRDSSTLPKGTRAFLEELALTNAADIVKDEQGAKQMKAVLEAQGYSVDFIPGLGRFIDTTLSQRFFMGTNAILSERFALIPGNRFPELDELNYKKFRRLGYEVYLMPSSAKTIECFGGIRCVSETFRH